MTGPPLRATRLNHVSIGVADVSAAAEFYERVFGMEPLPTPNFGLPVCWLRIGEAQLHLFESPHPVTGGHHFAIEVDDFEAAFLRLEELDLLDEAGYFSSVYEMPDGAVQMYFRDPFGNLVELDHPDLGRLDGSLFGRRLVRLDSMHEQTAENRAASLFSASGRLPSNPGV